MQKPLVSCAVLIPVYNDWESLDRLIADLDGIAAQLELYFQVFIVDDCSSATKEIEVPSAHRMSISIVRLICNMGHQRAIAIGLSQVSKLSAVDKVLVMDADGEDAPRYIPELISAWNASPNTVIVARRMHRSEGLMFKASYLAYKWAFMVLTGRRIDFGNYCLMSAESARRLVHMPECWTHLAASVLRSKLPIIGVKTRRGNRYFGKSTMNFVSLIMHGFSAISTFSDEVMTRIFLFGAGSCFFALGIAGATLAIRLFTNFAIPGWASNILGVSILLFVQSLTILIVLIFNKLASRMAVPVIPTVISSNYIARCDSL